MNERVRISMWDLAQQSHNDKVHCSPAAAITNEIMAKAPSPSQVCWGYFITANTWSWERPPVGCLCARWHHLVFSTVNCSKTDTRLQIQIRESKSALHDEQKRVKSREDSRVCVCVCVWEREDRSCLIYETFPLADGQTWKNVPVRQQMLETYSWYFFTAERTEQAALLHNLNLCHSLLFSVCSLLARMWSLFLI